MSFRFTSKTLFGAAAMVALGASMAAAQSGPTSTRRIPISKEQGGEVTKTDTITVYKTDTLRLTTQLPGRVDTVRTTQTNTVTVHDTVTMAPAVRLPNGFYFGIGAGVMAPNGSIYNTNSAGPSAQAQLGWQGAKQIIGLRADVNYAQPGEDSRYSGTQANPDIVNFSADAKLQLPFLSHLFGATHRFALYGIGGYTHTMYKNLPIRVLSGGTLPPGGGGVPFVAGTNDWTHKNGWNAGGGASLMWGRTELFVESRVLTFNDANINEARQMPFMLGINFY
jgi:hypothetical protein